MLCICAKNSNQQLRVCHEEDEMEFITKFFFSLKLCIANSSQYRMVWIWWYSFSWNKQILRTNIQSNDKIHTYSGRSINNNKKNSTKTLMIHLYVLIEIIHACTWCFLLCFTFYCCFIWCVPVMTIIYGIFVVYFFCAWPYASFLSSLDICYILFLLDFIWIECNCENAFVHRNQPINLPNSGFVSSIVSVFRSVGIL